MLIYNSCNLVYKRYVIIVSLVIQQITPVRLSILILEAAVVALLAMLALLPFIQDGVLALQTVSQMNMITVVLILDVLVSLLTVLVFL